jgi:hypothetical protein
MKLQKGFYEGGFSSFMYEGKMYAQWVLCKLACSIYLELLTALSFARPKERALRQAQDELQKTIPPAKGSLQTKARGDALYQRTFHKASMAGGNQRVMFLIDRRK